MKSKIKTFFPLFVLCFILLAVCSNPAGEEELATFTINLGDGSRAAYPPDIPSGTNTSAPAATDLRFVVYFSQGGTVAKQITRVGSDLIQDTISIGSYEVTMDIFLIADGSLYAYGAAIPSPTVSITAGSNPITVKVYDASLPALTGSLDVNPPATEGLWANAVLTATYSGPATGTASYTWWRDGTQIMGETSPTYTLTDDDLAKIITATIEFSGYSGNISTPKGISDFTGIYIRSQMESIGDDTTTLGKKYILARNIDLSVGGDWTPIGGQFNHFTGIFDGNGKTINDLTINDLAANYQGLFGYIGTGGEVRDVKLKDGSITCNNRAGALAGVSEGQVEDCNANDLNIMSNGTYAGGLIGENKGPLKRSYATGDVTASSYSGGLVGLNESTIQYCYATGAVECTGNVGGGLVADNHFGTIEYCYATGDVEGLNPSSQIFGGLAGNNDGIIRNCYTSGVVISPEAFAGGIVGLTFNPSQVINCYASGDISGYENVGGIIGNNSASSNTTVNCVGINQNIIATIDGSKAGRVAGNTTSGISNCYGKDIMTITGPGYSSTPGLGTKDGADVNINVYSFQPFWEGLGWDFTDDWEMDPMSRLPVLQNMP